MVNTFRLTACANQVEPGNPRMCFDSVVSTMTDVSALSPDIILFPAYSLSGVTGGKMLENALIPALCRSMLTDLASFASDLKACLLVGFPKIVSGRVRPAAAMICGGEMVNTFDFAPDCMEISHQPDSSDFHAFQIGPVKCCLLCCDPQNLLLYAGLLSKLAPDVVLVMSSVPVTVGFAARMESASSALSALLGCSVTVSCGGAGESSSPHLYQGFCCIHECGAKLCAEESNEPSLVCAGDIDLNIIRSKTKPAAENFPWPQYPKETSWVDRPLIRTLERNPFLPADFKAQMEYCRELFYLQAQSLSVRMKKIGLNRLVLGVSGGSDSALALMVCAQALKKLKLPAQNLCAVTMPGLGTSERTYQNAIGLIHSVGAELKELSVKDAVLCHLEDIGHDTKTTDHTFENAQTRERIQILLDLANRLDALVVGTLDLTEAALGFSTFGGDQVAHYNVNCSLTKMTVRRVISYLADQDDFENSRYYLLDILNTPSSPELQPLGGDGEIVQKSEELLAPFELLDFFLYYFIYYKMSPSKILEYAVMAFAPEFDRAFIKQKLELFLHKFFTGQFKRNASADGADLTGFALSPGEYFMPSDACCQAFIDEINNN